jgi:CRP-like cAMP-binding protein
MGSKCCPHIPITEPTQILNESYPSEDLQTTQRKENIIKSQNQKINNKENKEIPKIQNQSNNNKNEKEEMIKLKNSNQNIKNENFESPNSKEEKPEKQKVDSSGHLRKKQKNFFINEKEKDELKEDYEKSVLKIIQKHNRNNQDEELISNCLKKHFFMKDLDKEARKEIIREMSLVSVDENKYLFKQGGIGNYFYILKKGSIELISRNETKNIKIGESFGELALLHEAKRPESARTITECYLWIMERKNFKKIVEYITKKNYEENKQFIESIPILSNIDNTQKSLLCSSLYKESFDEGKYIVREGDPAQWLYIVKEGEVNCILKGKIVRTLRKGDNFGERSVLIDSTRSLDCVAKTKCICYSVSSSTLETMLGKNFRNLLYLNFIKSSFTRSKIFNKFNVNLLDNVFQLFKPFNLTKNEIAYKEGYIKSSKIVVVIDGNLINNITNDIVANRGDVLFEDELYEGLIEKTDFDIIPQPDCLLVEADSIQFFNLLGGNFQRLMEKTSVINCLSKVQIFKNLPRKKLVELSEKIIEENFEDGKSIVKEGENGNKFYIIKSGKVEILVNGKYIRTLNESEYFGERALFFHEKRRATINAIGEVCLFSISQKNF